jgi:putative N-acetyltransferase (TIGR04045 family)
MTRAPLSVWRAEGADVAAHLTIRHQVFVEEQGVMVLTDVDEWDRHPGVVHVLGASGDAIGGAVRLYPLDASGPGAGGRWKGDRLAVLPAFRASWLGAHLVRFAVATAAAADGTVMEANVQVPNVRFFERLGWERSGDAFSYFGLPHQRMVIDVSCTAPFDPGVRPARPRLALDLPSAASPLLEPV